MPIRYDRGELVPAQKTPEGYLYFDGRASRAGVFVYRRADGTTVRELRPPDEVGNPESLASLARKPVTNLHPDVLVDADNAAELAVGIVDPDIVWEQDYADGFIRVRGTVQRADAVDSIGSGRRELSCGYTVDIDETPGVWTDSAGVMHEYDVVQRNIRYNHLALVDRGRAGRDVRLRVDEAEMVDSIEIEIEASIEVEHSKPKQQMGLPPTGMAEPEKGRDMKIMIMGREFDLATEAPAIQRAIAEVEAMANEYKTKLEEKGGEVEAMAEDMEQATTAATEAQAKADAAQAELDVLKLKLDEEASTDTEADRIAWAKERMALVDFARKLKIDGYDNAETIEVSNDEIKRACVLSRFDEVDLPSDAHYDAAFALMRKDADSQTSTTPLATAIIGSQKSDSVDDEFKAAQAAYAKHMMCN